MLTTSLTLKIERDSGDVMRFAAYVEDRRVGEFTSTVVRGKRGAVHGSTYAVYLADGTAVGVRATFEAALKILAEAVTEPAAEPEPPTNNDGMYGGDCRTYPAPTTGLRVGDRVTRVRGTSIEGLTGHVATIEPSWDGKRLIALVQLEGSPEPGIGRQFVAPVDHLAPTPGLHPTGYGIDPDDGTSTAERAGFDRDNGASRMSREVREAFDPKAACICADLGATGPNQRHTLCRAHDVAGPARAELLRAGLTERQADNVIGAVACYGRQPGAQTSR